MISSINLFATQASPADIYRLRDA